MWSRLSTIPYSYDVVSTLWQRRRSPNYVVSTSKRLSTIIQKLMHTNAQICSNNTVYNKTTTFSDVVLIKFSLFGVILKWKVIQHTIKNFKRFKNLLVKLIFIEQNKKTYVPFERVCKKWKEVLFCWCFFHEWVSAAFINQILGIWHTMDSDCLYNINNGVFLA